MPNNGKPHLISPGDTFGRLTVIDFSHHDKRWRRHYSVSCQCGALKTVQGTLLRSGNTRSCGCLSREAKASKRLPDQRSSVNAIILQYKRHARDRGLIWGLSYEQVDVIVRKSCHYCGQDGTNIKRARNDKLGFRHNGIDRAENSIGYVFSNVVPCCGVCNKAKGTMSKSEFIGWAKKIAEQWG